LRERDAGATEKEQAMSPETGPNFTIIVNNKPYSTAQHELTGSQIKQLAAVPPDYELFQLKGTDSVPVGNDQVIHIHEREEFRAIPAGTFG